MSDIGYILLLRAVVKRAEQDAVSDDPKLRGEALAFLVEYGDKICAFLEQFMESAVDMRKRIREIIATADQDDEFRAAVNRQFVLYAVERYGAKPLSLVTGISRAKLRRGELTEDELKRLHTAVAEIDRRVVEHANHIAKMCGSNTVVRDPWAAVAVLQSLHSGELRM